MESPTTQAGPRIAAADNRNRTVGSAWSPKSRMIASTLRATVATSTTRPMIESCPRMGRPVDVEAALTS